MCVSPHLAGAPGGLARLLSTYPRLLPASTVDVYRPWPATARQQVARVLLPRKPWYQRTWHTSRGGGASSQRELREAVVQTLSTAHGLVESLGEPGIMSVTPRSFLTALDVFSDHVMRSRRRLEEEREKLQAGMNAVASAGRDVADMGDDLIVCSGGKVSVTATVHCAYCRCVFARTVQG